MNEFGALPILYVPSYAIKYELYTYLQKENDEPEPKWNEQCRNEQIQEELPLIKERVFDE